MAGCTHRGARRRTIGLLISALALTLPVAPARADLPPLIPRAILFGNPECSSPRLSPDGTRLAYLRPDDRDVLQVWVRTLGAGDDRAVTTDPGRGIQEFGWAWNGRDIHYLQDADGDENHHLYVTDVEANETRDMTPITGVRALVLATSPRRPDEIVVGMNRRDRQQIEPWRLDLKSGALTLMAENPGHLRPADYGTDLRQRHQGWLFDADLAIRGRVTGRDDGSAEIQLADTPPGTWRTLITWGAGEDVEPLEFPAEGRPYFVLTNGAGDTRGLHECNLATGALRRVAADPRADVERVAFDPATGEPQAVSFNRLRREWTVLDPSVAADWQALARVAPGDFEVVSRDTADRTWIVAYDRDRGAPVYHLWDRATRRSTLLFEAQPKLRAGGLAALKPVEIRARDGLVLPCLLTLPAGVPARRLPLVLLVHGGPWWRDTWGYNREVQWLANRGYAVLQVNFRGSNGFGRTFLNLSRRQFAGTMQDDLIDAVNWAVRSGHADSKRVGIMGWSYGGYAALVGLAFTPDLFACGIDGVGPSNLVTLIESFPPYWKPALARRWHPFVGNPADSADRADLLRRSPITRVDRIKAPLLIGQGARDPRVPQEQSDTIVEALRRRGVPVEYLVFDDEGHDWVKPQNNLRFYAAAEAFLARHLGGRHEPGN